ncbi:MAG: AAA domain-containing protein, partial [Sarcina sp.]
MKEILNRYKDRLVNLSGKNRSLAMKKLYKKRAFDLYNLNEFKTDIYQSILEYVNNPAEEKCYIVEDYSIYFAREKKSLDGIYSEKKMKLEIDSENLEIECQSNLKEKLKLEETFKTTENANFNKELLDKKQNIIKKCQSDLENKQNLKVAFTKLEEKYQSDLEKIEKKRDKLISYGQSIKALNKEISDIEKETGKRELYLAYPFVEGNFKDGTFFKAPLMIYQVSLKKDGDSWFISSSGESKITINKVFLLAIEKYNELKIEGIEEAYENVSKETIKEVIEKINNFGIYFDVNFDKLEKVNEYTAKNLPKYNLGAGKVVENIVIGQFPLANSIYKDYEDLIDNDLSNNLLESLLKTEEAETPEFELEEEHGKLSFSEKDLFFISQLDYSQELAVKKSVDSNKLVIYGPPGTGKSQTITNIISNSIATGKKVLMVSQKRAALDVIYNRLGELNSKAIIIHDVNADKKKFYGAVSNALGIDLIENRNYLKKITENSKFIDEKILNLEKLAKILNSEGEMGLTLQEMYSKSKVIESKSDLRFDKFMRYRKFAIKEGIDRVNYDELVDKVEKLNCDVIDAFLKYKELTDKNTEVDNIDISMTAIEISEAISELESAMEKDAIIQSINEREKFVFDAFCNAILEDKKILSNDKLKSISQKINEEKNKDIIGSKNIGEWWNLEDSNKEKYKEIQLLLEKNKYSVNEEDIIIFVDEFNNKKNSKLRVKLNEGNWWGIINGDEEIKNFVYLELKSVGFKFNEYDLESKGVKVYKESYKHLLEKIEEKSWLKRIFNSSKNRKKEEENQKIFYDGLENYKKESKRIAKEISDKYFENANKEKENLIKFEKE